MAKRRLKTRRSLVLVRNRRKIIVKTTGWRDVPQIAKHRLPTPKKILYADKRTFHPLRKARPVVTTAGTPLARYKPIPSLKPYNLAFDKPEKITVCVRRKRRKEVLFAQQKAGRRGLGRGRRRRINEDSKISCRS